MLAHEGSGKFIVRDPDLASRPSGFDRHNHVATLTMSFRGDLYHIPIVVTDQGTTARCPLVCANMSLAGIGFPGGTFVPSMTSLIAHYSEATNHGLPCALHP